MPANPLLEFASEAALTSAPSAPPASAPATKRGLLPVIVLTALAAVALGIPGVLSVLAGARPMGSLQVQSDPTGAEVVVDGETRGTTPTSFDLAPGQHELVVRHGVRSKQFAVAVAAGVQTVHHVAWAEPAAAPAAPVGPATGGIEISTDITGASVMVDGVDRGMAPVRLQDLAAGEHEVVVRAGDRALRRTVQVRPNAVASLVISNTTPAQASGWLTVAAPLALQIFEGGQLVGTTEAARIMLPTGDHVLEFAAPAVGFRSTQNVRISAGQTTKLSVQPPRAPVSINAVPWAEVWIDGEHVGQTPIANLPQTVGSHQVQFRHPQLGEKRVTVTVSLIEAARVAVDMRSK